MKKHDVGIPEKEMYGGVEVAKAKENRIIRPSFELLLKQLPELKGKDFNDKFTIEADVNIRSVSKDTNKIRYSLEILRMGVKGGKLSDEDFAKLSDDDQRKQMKASVKTT